ncbi:MAG: hypothetical protein Q8P33_02090 [bacterium]|nr:hypothetical protein [bacterium]
MRFIHSFWPARIGFALILFIEILGVTGVLGITPDFTWKGMIIQAVAIWGALEIVQVMINKMGLNMTLGPAALIIMVQLAIDATGDMGHLYSRFDWYDQILHLTGGFVAAIITTGLVRSLFERHGHSKHARFELLIYGFALSVVGQVIYELAEYLEDILTGSNRLGDGFDTVNDLTLGMFGALLAALIVTKLPKITRKR